MFKHLFYLGIVSGIFSSVVSYVYTILFAKIADFTEHTGFIRLFAFSICFSLGASLVNGLFNRLLKNANLASFVTNVLLSGCSLTCVFFVFEMNDPIFKNGDAQAMIDYYKGYLMPLLFIPALAWMSFKPLFTKP